MRLPELYSVLQAKRGAPPPDLAKAVREAASQTPDAFSSFLKTVDLDDHCALFEVYECLIQEADAHAETLATELKRLLAEAHESPCNRAIYSQLNVYATIHRPESLRRDVAGVLLAALNAPTPQVRRFAAHLAGDFLAPGSPLEARLRDLQVGDPDWRVRLLAHESLRDLHSKHRSLPSTPLLSFRDRIIQWLLAKRIHEFAA